MKEQKVALDETFANFDVSALFTIIRVPVALEIISRKFTEHINQIGTEHFLENTCFMPKDKIISLLELVLNSQVFSFHGKSYQELQEAAMGSPVSPVIFNIYMEYIEELALGSQCPYLPLGGKDMWMTFSA